MRMSHSLDPVSVSPLEPVWSEWMGFSAQNEILKIMATYIVPCLELESPES